MPEVDGGKRIQMKDEVKIINVGKWRKRELRGRKKKYFPPKLPSRQERENTVTPQPFFYIRGKKPILAVLIQPTCAFNFFLVLPTLLSFASKAGEMVPRAQYIFKVSYENSSKETKNNGISFVILHLSPSTPPLLAILRKTLQLPATFHTLNTSFTL